MKPLIILLFTGNIAFNVTANLLMKIGMKRAVEFNFASFEGLLKGFIFNWVLMLGAFAYVISLGFYLFAIKDVKLSIAYPLSVSCSITLVTLISAFALKESISVTQFVGGTIILIGIFVMTR